MGYITSWQTAFVAAMAICAMAMTFQYYWAPPLPQIESKNSELLRFDATGQSPICIALATALPGYVYSDHHPTYQKSVNSYWSLNACEVKPQCVVLPANTHEVAAAVKILKANFDSRTGSGPPLRFAVRSGGHSPEAGFASVDDGVVIDMSRVHEVTLSANKDTVMVGVGARWGDVYSRLDAEGLAIVGGRNSAVGVGGLVLGGGISFFSPRFGMVCDNINEYELVLANGTIMIVTHSNHENLWRALKGGSGNFGIVTRIKVPMFVSGRVWAGYAFYASWQASKVLRAFAEFNKLENFDQYAAGPLLALPYIQRLGLRIVATNMVYTKPEKWAPVFKGFNAIWRLWSTTKVQSLTDATHELQRMAPLGQRQFQVTTTITNDLDTFTAFNEIYTKEVPSLKNIRGLVASLVFQPLSAAVMRKGNPNVLGLDHRDANNTLIIVLFCVSWDHAEDDKLVHKLSRKIISQGEEYADRKGTSDRYRYLNYAASGQNPIDAYGALNKDFLRETSKLYDPQGFFQLAKKGGFKLDMY